MRGRGPGQAGQAAQDRSRGRRDTATTPGRRDSPSLARRNCVGSAQTRRWREQQTSEPVVEPSVDRGSDPACFDVDRCLCALSFAVGRFGLRSAFGRPSTIAFGDRTGSEDRVVAVARTAPWQRAGSVPMLRGRGWLALVVAAVEPFPTCRAAVRGGCSDLDLRPHDGRRPHIFDQGRVGLPGHPIYGDHCVR
jgi:hypothetical protein